jgi:hypothetical protein
VEQRRKAQVSVNHWTLLHTYSETNALRSSDLYADVAARWDCQNYYGYDKWFAGHRNGASGLANPNTADIQNYKNAIQWIQSQIDSNSKYRSDDTRFWVNVTPI